MDLWWIRITHVLPTRLQKTGVTLPSYDMWTTWSSCVRMDRKLPSSYYNSRRYMVTGLSCTEGTSFCTLAWTWTTVKRECWRYCWSNTLTKFLMTFQKRSPNQARAPTTRICLEPIKNQRPDTCRSSKPFNSIILWHSWYSYKREPLVIYKQQYHS